jgi:DNA-binding response OmpR family regulator
MTNKTELPRVLLAEDDDEMRILLASVLRKEGYEVTECRDGCELAEKIGPCLVPNAQRFIDLVISDIRMPGVLGLSVLEGGQQQEGFPPMIMITAFGDQETHAEVTRLGAAAMFDKPFDLQELLDKVREIVPLTAAA